MKSFISFVFLFCTLSLDAATIKVGVSSAGSGNGSDWNNKAGWSALTFVRGNVYELEDGSYPTKAYTTATSSTQTITIRKAIPSNQVGVAGWSDSMGDGQALIACPVLIKSDYWIFDGVTRTTGETGYGLVIDNHTAPVTNSCILLGDTSPSSAAHCTFRYVEVYGSGRTNDTIQDDGIVTANSGGSTDVTIQFCYFHDFDATAMAFRNTSNILIEDTVLKRNDSTPINHAEGIVVAATAGFTLRRSKVSDMEGTAGLATPYAGTHTCSNIAIYSCVFESPSTPLREAAGAAISIFGCTVNGYCYIVGNTFVGFQSSKYTGATDYKTTNGSITVGVGQSTTVANLVIQDNIWVLCEQIINPGVDANATLTSFTWSHNGYYSTTSTADPDATHKQIFGSNPIPNWTSGNYALAFATTAGAILSSPYNTDFAGATRGADGVWDRGAYEYSAGGGNPSATVTSLSVDNLILP